MKKFISSCLGIFALLCASVLTAAAPIVTLTPTSLTFASQALGSETHQRISLKNTGTDLLNISSIVASGVGFRIYNACGTRLGPGYGCDVWVYFKPLTSGTRAGAVTFTTNAATSPNAVVLTGTGAGTPPPPPPPAVAISIAPTSATLQANSTQQFSATVTNTTNTNVTWSASGAGSVTTTGLFTAGALAGTATVTATSVQDGSKSATATVLVTDLPPPPPPQPISVAISPTTASVQTGGQQQFTATVTNGVGVVWSTIGAGSVNTSGLFTASVSAGSATVTATSIQDGSKSASAAITVTAPPPPPPPPPPSGSATLRLFYTDLDSGPATGGQSNQGVFVTIYGNGFGATQGVSDVMVGGASVYGCPTWTNTKIACQIGSHAVSGVIVVTVNGQGSNGLPFSVRAGNIYFAGPGGSDTNSGSFAAPFASLTKCKNTLAAGDTCYALNGLVQGDDGIYGAALTLMTGGVAGAPKALVVYPGATATIGPGASRGALLSPEVSGSPWNYWTIAGFTLVTNKDAMDINITNGWRVVGNTMSCPNGNGMAACVETSQSTNMKVFGNYIHDVSTSVSGPSKKYHALYFSTDSNHIEAAWNTIANVNACRGIQFHSSPLGTGGTTGFNQYDLSVHDNLIHDVRCDGLNFATVDPSKGKVEAYNNVIYNAGLGPDPPDGSANYSCIYFAGITNNGSPGTGLVRVYNNTLYNCGARGGGDAGMLAVASNVLFTVEYTNNIIVAKGSETFFSPNSVLVSKVLGSNNLFFGGTTPAFLSSSAKNGDPLFVAPGSDFHLQPISPAKLAGIFTLAITDIEGTSRIGYSIGSYQ